LLDYSAIADEDDLAFAERLIRTVGVASIPVTPFYAVPPRLRVIRLCYAKSESTLSDAAARLCSM
jgi:methionine aminotransferase